MAVLQKKVTKIVVIAITLLKCHGWDDLDSIVARDCPVMFRASAGNVECHFDIDSRETSVVLESDGLPDHWYDENVFDPAPQSYLHSFPISHLRSQNDKEHLQQASQGQAGVPIQVGEVVGFALNGVPFRKAVHPSLTHIWQDNIVQRMDGCLGNVDTENCGAYYYVLPSPCMFGLKNRFNGAFETSDYIDAFASLGFPSPIIGYALDGYPIYGPYDSNGAPHSKLDSCHGKFMSQSSGYAYFATEEWPYLVNCFGPGVGSDSLFSLDGNAEEKVSKDTNKLDTNVNLNEVGDYGANERVTRVSYVTKLHCRDGYYRKPLSMSSISVVGQSSQANSQCLACPAGRFGSTIAAPSSSIDAVTPPQQTMIENCAHVCPLGHFCPEGSSSPIKCPAGKWGGSQSLTDKNCDGDCEAGYYCPEGSTSPNSLPCFGNASRFCPMGSPQPVLASVGYYTTSSHEQTPSLNNYYSADHSILEKEQLVRDRKLRTMSPVSLKQLSELTLHRSSQLLCEPGSYCVEGVKHACPAGTYGDTSGLTSKECSGECPLGHYCPIGTILPLPCPAGTFGGTTRLSTPECSGLCSPGYYCPIRSTSATQHACPAGRFGGAAGLTTDACSLNCESAQHLGNSNSPPLGGFCVTSSCEKGYYCPPASTSARQNKCGNSSVFCPEGSAVPTPVSEGHYTIGEFSLPGQYQKSSDEENRFSQLLCEPGSYCVEGVKHACPAGTYGDTSGLTSAQCSGFCERGYFCPLQSTSARQRHCGGAHVYCPGGDGYPLLVGAGNYSLGITALRLLRNDTYDSHSFYSSIDEEEGRGEWYTESYDPLDTVRDRAGQKRFQGRRAVGIPGLDITDLGSSLNRIAQASCPPGAYCEQGIARLCPAGKYGYEFGLDSPDCSGECGAGYYCPQGSILRRHAICGAGKWSDGGSGDERCDGDCEAGYYCPEGSTSARQNECGGETFYCPVGSGLPLNVSIGYYSTGQTITTRTSQVECKEAPPRGENMTKLCPSTTAPLSGPTDWYDGEVDEREYKKDVNDESVQLSD